MTNSESKVWIRRAEDKALINAIMAMDGWEPKQRGTYNAEYEMYLNKLDEDDFKLTYDEWIGA